MNQKDKPKLKMVVGGKEKEITFEQLALANNASLETLIRLLARKEIIEPKEFMKELRRVEKEKFKYGDKDS